MKRGFPQKILPFLSELIAKSVLTLIFNLRSYKKSYTIKEREEKANKGK